jgi:hypothetical protein
MVKRPAPPLWFVLLLGVLEALAWRWVTTALDVPADPRAGPAPPALAFWFLVGLIASWIWTGVQVAGRITLQILAWSVKVLWAFATAVRNAAIGIGRAFVEFGHKAWDFLKLTYDNVLKPAWKQFWEWFDKARKWLDDTFGPVLRFLDAVRTHILKFYDKWVRPFVDIIGFARQVLGILASLGLDWARRLDAKLRWLEEKIEAPFRLVLAKLNEIVNVVNRVVTADGLFQRLAYIRTLQRDVAYVWRGLFEPVDTKLTPDEQSRYGQPLPGKTRAEHIAELKTYIAQQDGPIAPRVNEWIADVALQVRRGS